MNGLPPNFSANWLDALAPPHAPLPVGWWPPAPGWWLLALLVVAAASALIYWQTRPQCRLRRRALRELRQIEALTLDDAMLARHLEHLLRRYAVARYGRDAVARLSGARWIDFVVAHGGRAWSGTTGAALLSAAYGGSVSAERSEWLRGARDFLRGAR